MEAVSVNPAAPRELYIVEQDEEIAHRKKTKIACIWQKVRLHNRDVNCCQFRPITKEIFSILTHCSKLG
jgi:hypothetical protein